MTPDEGKRRIWKEALCAVRVPAAVAARGQTGGEFRFATSRAYLSACSENGIEAEGVAIRITAYDSA